MPAPENEPVNSYAPGTPARASLKKELDAQAARHVDIPIVIGGEEIQTGVTLTQPMPHDHGHTLATYHRASAAHVQQAIDSALEAHREWSRWPWEDRARVFLRAAELLSTTWRDTLNAATMLGQSKTAYQTEIDAACELIDFLRFNVHFAQQIYERQSSSTPDVLNWSEQRPLEGFVYAVSPFNFTAIGGNLTGAPLLMGNTVVWKPSHSAVLSSYYTQKLFEAAGLPPGVLNFIPGDPVEVTEVVLSDPNFAGLHFTGSTDVFRGIWREVGNRIDTYRSYPRLVGETGGKDFVVAHPSANADALRTALVRGAFEYQGQKCSAASRAYIPQSVWEKMGQDFVDQTESLTMGDPRDFRNFMTAVIHQRAFDKITGYIEGAKSSGDSEVIAGGSADDSKGWFIRPTVIRTTDPRYVTMCDEIFGPVLTVHVYPDSDWSDILETVNTTSPYALTGAVFAEDRGAVHQAFDHLRDAAGNFYVNDKPTGAVVGQQPFGGARASGTNDKAGSSLNLLRWVSPRSVKETFVPPTDYRYPFMDAE